MFIIFVNLFNQTIIMVKDFIGDITLLFIMVSENLELFVCPCKKTQAMLQIYGTRTAP